MISKQATYEIYSENSDTEKDHLISQLKAEIIEKEQISNNYLELQSKFRTLQNNYQLLCEEKLHLEYELRGNSENENKSVSELQFHKKNILNELDDKITMNKKLYNDNDNLSKIIQSKENEDLTLRSQINEQEEILSKLSNDKINLQKQISTMNHTKQSHVTNIQRLKNELQHLLDLHAMKDQNLKEQNEKNQQMKKELYFQQTENNSIKSNLQSKQDSLNDSQNQLRFANNTILKMEQDLNALSNQLSRNKSDLSNLHYNLNQEISRREILEKHNKKLESVIKERDNDINKYTNENNELKIHVEGINNDLRKLNHDLEKYKHYILILTEHNSKLTKEIESIFERDMKLKIMLNNSERIGMLAEQNRQIVNNSLDHLKAYLDSSNSNKTKIITTINNQHSSFNGKKEF